MNTEVYFLIDEWYPIINVLRDDPFLGSNATIPDELLNRYEENLRVFRAIQEELRDYLED